LRKILVQSSKIKINLFIQNIINPSYNKVEALFPRTSLTLYTLFAQQTVKTLYSHFFFPFLVEYLSSECNDVNFRINITRAD